MAVSNGVSYSRVSGVPLCIPTSFLGLHPWLPYLNKFKQVEIAEFKVFIETVIWNATNSEQLQGHILC